jgi:uncharacterized protein YjbI with pentapeptide repeats
MACCKSIKYGWCKDIPIVDYKDKDNNEFCIFHAPCNRKGKSPEEFNKAVFDRIELAQRNKETCYFDGTIFEHPITFAASFANIELPSISFADAEFHGKVKFGGDDAFVKFIGETFFTGAVFKQDVDFAEAEFSGEAYFYKETFQVGADFSLVIIKNRIRFEEVNLKAVSFLDTDVRNIDFISCKFPQVENTDVLYDETNLDRSSTRDDIEKVERLYRFLKQKYKEEHDEQLVSKWHYREKEMQRRKSNYKQSLFYILNVYWLSSGYAERPGRASLFLTVLLLALSLLLALAGLKVTDGSEVHGISYIKWPNDFNIHKTWALILNTLKYGTFQKDAFLTPINWFGETIKVIAQIFIPIQSAFVAFALRNRYRR